ncbi:hypothetical protein V5E97_11710 [Singulisphaera sp. Ch08]|uniref:Uncharacterized protein n=1 Tax=Singulisphaera sp. Ch08 TaxID=3120278 RepID=A0AAU7CNF4_9BACT
MEESPELEAATQAEYSHRDKLMTASVKWAPLFHRIHGMSVIVIPDFSQYIDLPWHRVLILKIIMLTVKDRGSQILFEPCRSKDPGDESAIDLKITYEVDGKSYDLVLLQARSGP